MLVQAPGQQGMERGRPEQGLEQGPEQQGLEPGSRQQGVVQGRPEQGLERSSRQQGLERRRSPGPARQHQCESYGACSDDYRFPAVHTVVMTMENLKPSMYAMELHTWKRTWNLVGPLAAGG